MYMTLPLFIISLLLTQPIKAHDPRHRLCDLIALPLPDQCKALSECQAILKSNCQDDTCACAYSGKASTCVQCMSTGESEDKYNDYLGACASIGQAGPSPSYAVRPSLDSNAVSSLPTVEQTQSASYNTGQFTDITAAGGVETQAGSASLVYSSSIVSVIPTAAVSSVGSASVYRGLGGQTGTATSTGSPASLNSGLPAPLNGGLSNQAVNTSDTHGISVLNTTTPSLQTPSALDAPTTALNSSRNFFSQAISRACVRHCVSWKTRADMCSDDRCLCTSDVIYTAGVCSDCVGDSGRGGQIGTCYSEFKNACEIATVGTTASGSVASAAGQGTLTDQLGPAGTSLGGAQSGLPYGYGPSGSGQVEPMLVTDTQGVTYSVTGSALTTQIVTATAGALIAQETVVVDASGESGNLRVSGLSIMVGSLMGLMAVLA